MDAQKNPVIQVHLVAPQLVAWGLRRLVQAAGAPFFLAAASATLDEALPLLERDPPDVLLLDLDDGYGPADVRGLYERHRPKLLAITSSRDGGLLDQVLAAGVRGVLQNRAGPAALLKAIEAVAAGQQYGARAASDRSFLASVPAALAAPRPRDPREEMLSILTVRERRTLHAVTADAAVPVKVLADRLCISEQTLRNHLTSIYSKLGVNGRLGLYAYATEHRLGARA